jgi:hypothetical protein
MINFKSFYFLPTIYSIVLAFLCAYSMSIILDFNSTTSLITIFFNVSLFDSVILTMLIASFTALSLTFNTIYVSNI